MTNLIMLDGINSLAAGISKAFPNAAKVAGYLNGIYAWSQAQWSLFPHAGHVTISVTAFANEGDVLDVETGDAIPAETAAWIAARKSAGLFRPTIYCSLDVVPDVRRATGSYVLGRDYDIWVAHYTGQPHQAYPGCAATQYESTAGWDASLVHDPEWPHRKPPGTPPAGAVWPAGVILKFGDRGGAVTALQEALNATHLPGVRNIEVSGSFSLQTQTAVRNFEAAKGLTVDAGVAGPQVRAALGIR